MPADRQSGKHGQARQPAARADSRPVRLDWQADAPACIPDRVHDRRFTVIRLGHTECRRGEGLLRGRDAERPRSPRPSWHRPALMGTRLPDAGGAGLRKGIPRESRCAQGGARAVARGGESVGPASAANAGAHPSRRRRGRGAIPRDRSYGLWRLRRADTPGKAGQTLCYLWATATVSKAL